MSYTSPGGPWDLVDLEGSWLRVCLPDVLGAVVVIEHDERQFHVASAYPEGTRREVLGARLPESPIVRLYRAPDEPDARLAVVMGTAFGSDIPDEFEPSRLVERVAALVALTTPGETVPIASVNRATGRGPDLFISYASEDLDAVAAPLADELRSVHNLDVFLGDIAIGASIRRSIDSGIASSWASVPILSPSYLVKGWPLYELDGIVDLAVAGQHSMFPVWHQLDHRQISEFSPSLANRRALETSQTTIPEMAAAIAQGMEVRHHSL